MSEIQSCLSEEVDPLVKTAGPSFPRFQELLEELRLEIWKRALPGPRLVDICSDAPTPIDSHRCTPAILHVCSESRKEALKLYTALPLGYYAFRAVYVNFQIDTLYFSHYGWMSHWSLAGYGLKIQQLMDNLRFLAIPPRVWIVWKSNYPAIRFIQGFRKLEELNVPVCDAGTGKITDEYESEVWDEWRIGDEVGVAIRTSECDWEYLKYLKVIESGVMTRQYGGLKNIKVRLVTVQRAGPEEEIPSEDYRL